MVLRFNRQPQIRSLFTLPKMKTKITLIIALLAGLCFASCESSAKLNGIRIGMSKGDVLGLMGTPDSMSAQANVEYLTYYLQSDSGYGRDQPYMVRLVDGKVESFGRFAQLFDLYNRPVTNALPGQNDFPQGAINPANSMGGATVVRTYSGPAVKADLATQLEKLKALKDQGVLTEDEFQKAKEKVLSQP
jgi:hypothetical protein